MGIPDVSKLELMPNAQEFRLEASHFVDLKRRRGIMLKSVEGNTFPVLNESKDKPMVPYFINFEFFVSNIKSKELSLPEGIFIIPPPSSKLENTGHAIWSRDVDDFSPNDSVS